MKILTIVHYKPKHIDAVWIWRNDIQTIKMSLSRKKVTWQEHFDWSQSIISSKSRYMYVAEELEVPIGVIRFDLDKYKNFIYHLTINIDPNKRGMGYGTIILDETINLFTSENKKCKYIKAKIRNINVKSIKLFENYGFKKISPTSEINEYIFETKNN